MPSLTQNQMKNLLAVINRVQNNRRRYGLNKRGQSLGGGARAGISTYKKPKTKTLHSRVKTSIKKLKNKLKLKV